MKKITRQGLMLAFGVYAALLSACGGSKTEDSSKSALLGACDPASGPAGTQVTCPLKDIEEDCTFFFAGQPTDFARNAEDSFSFTVPSTISGTQEMSFQCGDGEPLSAGTFAVTPSSSNEAAPSDGGETIVPTETTGGTGTGGTTTGEGTTGGTTTGGTTTGGETPPADTPAAATSASIDALTVESVEGSSVRFRTLHVTFSASNVKAAYLWGNILNREPEDMEGDASVACKLQGTRYLVTNSDGTDLSVGSANYETYQALSEGVLCEDSNCRDASSQSSLKPVVKQDTVFQEAGSIKTEVLKPGLPAVEAAATDDCRIDLVVDGSSVKGDFYTRSLVQNGELCLSVQGSDGMWQDRCVTGTESAALTAPAVDLDRESVVIKASDEKIAFTLAFDGLNAVKSNVDGCEKVSKTFDDFKGTVHYEGECAVDAETKTVTVTLTGMGKDNVKTATYELKLEKPGDKDVRITRDSAPSSSSTGGQIKLTCEANRPFTITDDEGTVVEEGSQPWFKYKKLDGFKNEKLNDKTPVESPSDLNYTIDPVNYDFEYMNWTFTVFDFDGGKYEDSATVEGKIYNPELEIPVLNGKVGYHFTYDSCDDGDWFETECCDPSTGTGCKHDSADGVWECNNYVMHLEGSWSGKDLTAIHVRCEGAGEDAGNTEKDLDNVEGQVAGTFKFDVDGEKATCTFEGTTVTGEVVKVTETWKRSKGSSYCDGPDLDDGSDHDDYNYEWDN